MTVRELYRNVLIELNKEEASALYVEDFLYYANKATNWYANARYNIYDTSQQLGDDLRALRKGPEKLLFGNDLIDEVARREEAAILACKETADSEYTACEEMCEDNEDCIEACETSKNIKYTTCSKIQLKGGNLELLEYKYRHLLNCIVTIKLDSYAFECSQQPGTTRQYAAKRLTADRKAAIINNAFLDPRFYRPYFDIIGDNLQILTGDVPEDKFSVESVTIEYLKNPKELKLTEEQLLIEKDTSEKMEFPEYVCIEIVNTLVVMIMEQGGDPRLNSQMGINQTIASPIQNNNKK